MREETRETNLFTVTNLPTILTRLAQTMCGLLENDDVTRSEKLQTVKKTSFHNDNNKHAGYLLH